MRATDRIGWRVRPITVVLLGMFLSGAIAQAQTAPPKVIVEDVVPQGNHLVPSQKIISLIKTRPGGEYNPETVQDDVRKLVETKLFANVLVRLDRTAENKVKVYFYVAEFATTIQEIVYNGAKHLKPDELETLTGLRKGAPLNPVANRMAVNAIQRRYEEMGRLFAGVELVEGDKPGDSRVVFNITEGPVVHVSSISFVGNTFVSGARLNTQIDSSHEFLHLFGGRFDPMLADHDVAKLEEYYKRYGFQDVHVSREFQWEEDHRHVRLVFHIREGPRYRVTATQVEGNKILEENLLLSQSKLRAGDYYSKDKAEGDIALMQAIYGNRGYGVTVREHDFSTAPGEVSVHYEVQEKPPARVGEIRVIGNDVTRQNVILRQVPLYSGQVLTYPDLRLAERNLAKLGIFETNAQTGVRPTVSVIDPDSDTEFKDILVQVQEQPTGSLIFGVGVNSDAGLTGSIVLNERNFDITRWPTSFDDLLSGHAFRGAGQEFRLEAVPGTQLQRYTASWREPYLFDSQYSLGLSAYYWDRIYNEYTESRLGARAVVSRRLNQYWSASVTGRIERVGIHNVPFFEPFDFQEAHGDHFLTSLRFGLTRDSRDSYLRATEGSLIDMSFEQFMGDFTFPQLNFEVNKFWTIYERADGSGRHVLAARSAISWTSSHTPVFERFYAGGFRSMRGFEFRGVGPAIEGFELGGDFMFLNSLEYQVPILANDNLYAVFFCDTGTVEREVEIRDYRVSVGFGLRVVVPMMGPLPIALDVGFPIVKGPNDHEQVFSFWVGFFH
ncbi:MAG TPA: outer membrane protein assembly factor BamA [Gemmataceae bacterium]|nr:outer membrane protein assembly factor BamA [Gemmataceae bacterium]